MSKRERNREETLKKQALLTLFKKLVRSIIFNSHWLAADEEDQFAQKKHISLVMRRKRKVGSLTAADKSIIRMAHNHRTIADRKKLCDLYARLRCFERFPPKIRARLVPAIKFLSIAPGRVIMKKGDLPFAMYFILTGEVEMIQRSYSKLFEKEFDEVESIFGPGDCIGDVAIMENSPRSHTFLAASHCELLVLFDYDMPILEPFMKKLWTEKKKALKALDYFDFLDDDQIINACRFGSIRQFNPLDTIYSQDKGSLTNVHFVLSGECIILQCLNMKVTMKNGKKVFSLPDWSHGEAPLLISKTSSFTLNRRTKNDDEDVAIPDFVRSSSSNETESREEKMHRKMELRDVDRLCGLINGTGTPSEYQEETQEVQKKYEDEQYEYLNFTDNEESQEVEVEVFNNNKRDNSLTNIEEHSDTSTESEVFTLTTSHSSSRSSTSDSRFFEFPSKSSATVKYESHFIDVGSLTFGGIFGLGEKMEDRVILARTTVQCLTLPRYFLLEKEQNPGNIWQRRLFYLDCTIPSREALFTDFIRSRNWREFKKNFIYKNLDCNVNDITKNYDIPIICRIVETTDDE